MSVGEGGHERGEPHRAQGTFSVFEIKKKKNPQKNPTQKYSEAVGVFYWDWGKGSKDRRHHSGGEAGLGPPVSKAQGRLMRDVCGPPLPALGEGAGPAAH